MSLLCGFMIPLLRISCADELLSQLEVQGNLEKLKELWSAQGVLLQPLWRGGEREAGPWEAYQSMADALCGDLPAQSWVSAEDSTRQLLDACPSWSVLPSICSGAAWENQDPCPRTNALGQPSSWDAAGRRTAAVWWCSLSRLIRGSRCLAWDKAHKPRPFQAQKILKAPPATGRSLKKICAGPPIEKMVRKSWWRGLGVHYGRG